MDKGDLGGWAVGGVAFGAGAGVLYGLVKVIAALLVPVGNALVDVVASLLAMLIAALLAIAAVMVILLALRLATVAVIDDVRAQLARISADAADSAVDAAMLGGLALVVGLVAYLSTGDWLKGNELGLIKGLALGTMLIAVCKFVLSSGARPFRHAVIPVLVLAYLGIVVFAGYYWQARCAGETRETALECMLEMHDDPPEHNGEDIARLATLIEDMARRLTALAQRPTANAQAPTASAAASSVVQSAAEARTAEGRPDTPAAVREAPSEGIKRHVFLVTGHVMVFAAALFAMAYPFRLAGWKRLLGLGK